MQKLSKMYMPIYTTQQAFVKLASFCAYQERCHAEVREKLATFQLSADEIEEVIAKLIEENFLNEQRFAVAFAGGKFRVKQWGKLKIRYELKQKGISETCIRKALTEIADEDYYATLETLATKKAENETNRQKIYQFLLGKGYESGLINEVLEGLKND
jgi:regulatory protein